MRHHLLIKAEAIASRLSTNGVCGALDTCKRLTGFSIHRRQQRAFKTIARRLLPGAFNQQQLNSGAVACTSSGWLLIQSENRSLYHRIHKQNQRSLSTTNNIMGSKRGDPGEELNSNEYGTILLSSPSKHVAHIELNRPKTRNAFGLDSARELSSAISALDEDSSVRCVVLSGKGPDLTSGVDLKSFMGAYEQLQEVEDIGQRAKFLRKLVLQFQDPFKRMVSLPKPIICVQHGLCYGLGMELAACSDIRYCSSKAKMAIREVLIGIAADVGNLQLMPRLVSNQSLLRELIYTGRDMTADEALRLGFVSRICNSKEAAIDEAIETAKLIASKSPVAVQGSKQNLHFSSDTPFQVGLDYSAVWNMSMMQSGDVVKAIKGILDKAEQVEYDDH